MLTTRQTCRICANSKLTTVLSLGDQYLASYFANERFSSLERRIPLELVRCDTTQNEKACGLVQLKHTVPQDFMYSAYGYKSGINEWMSKHLQQLACGIEKMVKLDKDDLVVDVGANDGTLLMGYSNKKVKKIGFEPSNVAPSDSELPEDIFYIRDYFNQKSFNNVYPGRKAKIITSIAMFYDLENPHSFVADVAALLAQDGVWVIELSYLPSMLKQRSFDTICHEHLEYYHLGPMEHLLGAHGLRVFDVETNAANGGSFRVFVCHANSGWYRRYSDSFFRVLHFRKDEFEFGVDCDTAFTEFSKNAENVKYDLKKLLLTVRNSGKTVCGYGASTKGNVLLQYCGIDSTLLTAIAERNPAKFGLETLGTNIPIISEDEVRKLKPDYLLILPWHFLDTFVAREKEFLLRGGRFIVPLPEVKILGVGGKSYSLDQPVSGSC